MGGRAAAALLLVCGAAEAQHRAVSFAPILAYDPVPGPIVGAAAFSTTDEKGTDVLAQVMAAPAQPRGEAALDIAWWGAFPGWTPRISLRFHSFLGDYYGLGMTPDGAASIGMQPVTAKARAGLVRHLSPRFSFAVDGFYYFRSEGARDKLDAAAQGADGPLDGAWVGLQVEAIYDSREHTWGDAEGVRLRGWMREWSVQGTRALPRLLFGGEASWYARLDERFLLALHGEAAESFGARGILSTLSLGGAEGLRGYVSDRFRGDGLLLAESELRAAVVENFTGVVFAEAGRTLLNGGDPNARIAYDAGVGARYDLPPGRRARVRCDLGWSTERLALFITFGEAF